MRPVKKEKTGIRTLKIKYNRVFGYYIEVSNSALKIRVPEHYIRKQTLANAERYVTQELKDLEHTILTASDRVSALEYELFSALRQEIADAAGRIQKTAAEVAELDAYASLAAVAVRNGYACPTVDESGVIEIHDGRHPVVEKVLRDSLFVPNDTFMGEKEDRTAIITGPNYGRQVHLYAPGCPDCPAGSDRFLCSRKIRPHRHRGPYFHPYRRQRRPVLRPIHFHGGNERGSLHPAAGHLPLAADSRRDRPRHLHFRRYEHRPGCAGILRRQKKLGAKTLFATHYHELTEMEQALPGVKNYNIAVKAHGDEISFPAQDHPRRRRPQLRY